MNWKFCPICGESNVLESPNQTVTKCTNCNYMHFNNARASVAIAFVKNDKILVSKRGIEPKKDMYDLPGGFVDFGETVYEASVREIHEELGIDITKNNLILLDAYHNIYDENTSTVDIVFMISKWDGAFVPSSDSAELEWKPLDFIYDPLFCEKFYTGLDKAILAELAKRG